MSRNNPIVIEENQEFSIGDRICTWKYTDIHKQNIVIIYNNIVPPKTTFTGTNVHPKKSKRKKK